MLCAVYGDNPPENGLHTIYGSVYLNIRIDVATLMRMFDRNRDGKFLMLWMLWS